MKSPQIARELPDLPAPIRNGAGARFGDLLFAGLGSAGSIWLALDLQSAAPQWVELAPFPGPAREQARAVAVDGAICVFGGIGQSGDRTISFDDVHRYEPERNRWQRLQTRSPLGLLGGALWSPDGRQVLVAGGVNKAIIEGYFDDMAAGADETAKARVTEAYFDRKPEDYLFTADALGYVPVTNRWTKLGRLPFPPTVGAAAAVDAMGRLTLVNGEVKPGLRSRAVEIGSFDGAHLSWSDLPDLTGKTAETAQEGLAGAYAGHVGDVLLVAGGTNFPGSWAAYEAGKSWAHRGLIKTWHDTIYALVDGQWQVAGSLPYGMASGLSFTLDGGVLLVGGELQGGEPIADVMLLRFDGKSATIT